MPTQPILVLNSGSSSIKFSMWEDAADQPEKLLEGELEGIGEGHGKDASFWIKLWMGNAGGAKVLEEKPDAGDIAAAFNNIVKALGQLNLPQPAAIGHRMVCGGPTVIEHQRITSALLEEMERYTHFAPLHSPSEIFLMRQAMQMWPQTPNFVCVDSRFHRDLPEVTRQLPIPGEYTALGVRRFGAHGLSYESIVNHLGPDLPSRVIAAHLGNGASICAIRGGQSVDTSMGLTPTGGLISGSRTGDLDPGAMIFLLRELAKNQSDVNKAADQLEAAVNKHSGLLGVSQLTNDMRQLRKAINEGNTAARLAVSQFVYVLRKYVGAYATALGGLDLLVFTGGIGENDAATRAELCTGMEWLGIALDPARNQAAKGEAVISTGNSSVTVKVIPAAEDLTIARHVRRLF
jgi:acetate kinase